MDVAEDGVAGVVVVDEDEDAMAAPAWSRESFRPNSERVDWGKSYVYCLMSKRAKSLRIKE